MRGGLLARTLRGFREHLYLSGVSAGVIATSLVLLGALSLAASNLRVALGTWEQDVHLSAYLRDGVDDAARTQLQEAVAGRIEVAEVQLVTEAEASEWLTARMPDLTPVVTELGPSALPASLEVTLRPQYTSPERIAAFAASLGESPAIEEVDYGQQWVARVRTFVSLLGAVGVVMAVIVCVATLFLVGNTTHLVVHARRDELEIMRLVGATDRFIVSPFLLEGAIQGVVGGLLAVGVLYGVYRGVLVGAADLFTVAVGDSGLRFLPVPLLGAMVVGGGAIGVLAAWVTVRRALRTLP